MNNESVNIKKRGILKSRKSLGEMKCRLNLKKRPTFDETNILETYHPKDKDYGFMKIEEAKTPYNYESDPEERKDSDAIDNRKVDANVLAAKIAVKNGISYRKYRSADKEDIELMTEEEKQKRLQFEMKRKEHYNEYYAVKMARELMECDEDTSGGSSIDQFQRQY